MQSMNEMNFQMEGPVMTGRWEHPRTHDSFTVRDCFFQDNDLMVQTTDGRLLNYNTIQDYVKTDKPLPRTTDSRASKAKPATPEVPASVEAMLEVADDAANDNGMLPEDAMLLQGRPQPAVSQPVTRHNTVVPQVSLEQLQATEDKRLIERVLKRSTAPEILAEIKWSKFPRKQLECLLDMMGVDLEDIVTYYIDKLDLNEIRESLKVQLLQSIEHELDDEVTTAASTEMIVEESPVAKKTTKKTTKK